MTSIKFTGITEFQETLKGFERRLQNQLKLKRKSKAIEIKLGVNYEIKLKKSEDINKLLNTLKASIKKVHKKAMLSVANDLENALNNAMSSPVWQWTNDIRDIVDTGALMDSLKLILDSDGDIHILYNEDYAAIVHYGGYFNPYGNPNVKLYYPGRPWVDSILFGGGPVEQFNIELSYAQHFQKLLDEITA